MDTAVVVALISLAGSIVTVVVTATLSSRPIATGLRADGPREVLGVDVGDSEIEVFWREFLTGLIDRGLAGCVW